MFDKKTNAVIGYLESQCSDGAFKVLEKAEIISALPSKLGITADVLDDVINFLQEKEFLVSKYNDEEQICVALTPKATVVPLSKKQPPVSVKVSKKVYWLIGAVAFFATFLGTFLSVIITKFIGF